MFFELLLFLLLSDAQGLPDLEVLQVI